MYYSLISSKENYIQALVTQSKSNNLQPIKKKKKKKFNIYQDFQKNGYQKYFEIKYLKVYLNNNKKIL